MELPFHICRYTLARFFIRTCLAWLPDGCPVSTQLNCQLRIWKLCPDSPEALGLPPSACLYASGTHLYGMSALIALPGLNSAGAFPCGWAPRGSHVCPCTGRGRAGRLPRPPSWGVLSSTVSLDCKFLARLLPAQLRPQASKPRAFPLHFSLGLPLLADKKKIL